MLLFRFCFSNSSEVAGERCSPLQVFYCLLLLSDINSVVILAGEHCSPLQCCACFIFRNNSLYGKNESDLVNFLLFLHFSVFLFLFLLLSLTPWRTQIFRIMLLFRFYISNAVEVASEQCSPPTCVVLVYFGFVLVIFTKCRRTMFAPTYALLLLFVYNINSVAIL